MRQACVTVLSFIASAPVQQSLPKLLRSCAQHNECDGPLPTSGKAFAERAISTTIAAVNAKLNVSTPLGVNVQIQFATKNLWSPMP